MIVAISMRVVTHGAYDEIRDAISHDWVVTLDALSITPVFVPNALRDPAAYLRKIDARGLILTGGDDLGPISGESGAEAKPNARDRTETDLLSYALDQGLPVFGACRGLQLINVYFGGSLTRHLGPASEHVDIVHPVEIIDSTPVSDHGSNHVDTNSYHNQGVLLDDLAADLKPFALAPGEVVEGLYHPSLPVVAIQWHPERQNPAWRLDRALMRGWMARCA